jgi:hypothetical protein
MRTSAAAAGLVSAAVLLVPACDEPALPPPSLDEPVRRANFRSLVALDYLESCPGGAARAETRHQRARHEELKQLAARKQAGQAIWLGESDWAAVRRYQDREPCPPGEAAFGEALAAFSGTLDELAARIAAFPASAQ